MYREVRVPDDDEDVEGVEKKLLLLLTRFFALVVKVPLNDLLSRRRMGSKSSDVESCESRVVACSVAMNPTPSILTAMRARGTSLTTGQCVGEEARGY